METRSLITKCARRKTQYGATAVEFALIAPLFFLVFFAIIELGFVLYNQQVVTNAAREGARHGIVARPAGRKETAASIEQVARDDWERFVFSFGATNFQVDVNPNQCDGFGDALTVEVTYDYDYLVVGNLLGLFGANADTGLQGLSATAVMLCE